MRIGTINALAAAIEDGDEERELFQLAKLASQAGKASTAGHSDDLNEIFQDVVSQGMAQLALAMLETLPENLLDR